MTTVLGEIALVQTGPFGSQLHASDYTPQGVPVVMPQNIGENRIVEDSIARINDRDVERLGKHKLRHGDIIYSRRGDVERRALIRHGEAGWLCGTGCLLVRPKPLLVDPQWLSYWLGASWSREFIVRNAVGATMLNLNTGILASVPVELPPLVDQKRVATILGTLDDKIELNQRTNETLEDMARTLFRSWFVDFEPVRVKSRRGDLVKQLGLGPAIVDAFPAVLEHSKVGPIPVGWDCVSLSTLAQFVNGAPMQRYPADDPDFSFPVIKGAELRRGITEASDRASRDIPNEFLVSDGDLLFSWSGSLIVKLWVGGEGALNQHVFKVIPNAYPRWFVHGWLEEHLPSFKDIAAGKATTMGHIQRGHLDHAFCYAPPPILLSRLDTLMRPIYDLSIRLSLEQRELAAVRDYLLPRLLSGQAAISQEPEKLHAHL